MGKRARSPIQTLSLCSEEMASVHRVHGLPTELLVYPKVSISNLKHCLLIHERQHLKEKASFWPLMYKYRVLD